jgi:predicted Zn-dependent peptidase
LVAPVDADALRQMLLNLLDNAVKYGPAQQTITVSLEALDGRARIRVEDEGPGIPAADRERVWDRFWRLERDRGSAVAGTGIGLSVVRELVALHGGRAGHIYRRLVLEQQLAVDTEGGIHYPTGDVFDYNGPAQMVTRILHKPEFTADQTLAAFDAVIREVQEKGIGADELEQVKVKFLSDYYSHLESGRGGYMPRYGLMHCLACFTLFDRDPQLVNTILEGFLNVTPGEAQAAAQKYLVPRKRAIVLRQPVAKGAS